VHLEKLALWKQKCICEKGIRRSFPHIMHLWNLLSDNHKSDQMKILSDKHQFDVAKTHSLYYSEKVIKSVDQNKHSTWEMSITSQYLWDLIDEWTHFGIHDDTFVLRNTWLSPCYGNEYFWLKNTPLFTTITPYGLFIGLDTTWVIKMKTITLQVLDSWSLALITMI